MDLSVWCYKCINDKNNKNKKNKKNNNNKKGFYIKSEITDEYIKIYCDYFKFSGEKNEKKEEARNKNVAFNEKYKKENKMNKNGLCEHINNITKEEWEKSEFIKGVEEYIKKKSNMFMMSYVFLVMNNLILMTN